MVDDSILILPPLQKPWLSPSPKTQRAVLRFDIHYCVLWHTNLDEGHLWCHSAYRPLSLIKQQQMSRNSPRLWWEVFSRRKLHMKKNVGSILLRCCFLGGRGKIWFKCQWGGKHASPESPEKNEFVGVTKSQSRNPMNKEERVVSIVACYHKKYEKCVYMFETCTILPYSSN